MKILLDHCVPDDLRAELKGHEVFTTRDKRWEVLSNGALLAAAGKDGLDVFLTVDANIRFQQNLKALPIAVLFVEVRSNRMEHLLPLLPKILSTLKQVKPRTYVEVAAR